jgi:hypothetical protein
MNKFSKPDHTTVPQGYEAPPLDEVVYLVKRPGYAFMLRRPKTRSHGVNEGRESWHVRFRDRQGSQTGILDLEGLQDFYDSLSQLMEYIHSEREQPSRGIRCAPPA